MVVVNGHALHGCPIKDVQKKKRKERKDETVVVRRSGIFFLSPFFIKKGGGTSSLQLNVHQSCFFSRIFRIMKQNQSFTI